MTRARGSGVVATIIEGRRRDLGDGFVVRRVLPAVERRMVGPFIFLDQMGPVTLAPGRGLDVRPHPHIALATVTYLFEGEIFHRDSLGSAQPIHPGAINWMIAGRGIVHSERTPPGPRAGGATLHGLQMWVALPKAHEEDAPEFHHHPADTIPALELGRAKLRVLVGSAFGRTSPVAVRSPMFYVDVALPAGEVLAVPVEHEERAIYVVEGAIQVAELRVEAGRLAVLEPGAEVALRADGDARLVLLGGAPLDGPRHIFWNFVSSSPERIEQAKEDWRAERFPKVPGDEVERIPLPE